MLNLKSKAFEERINKECGKRFKHIMFSVLWGILLTWVIIYQIKEYKINLLNLPNRQNTVQSQQEIGKKKITAYWTIFDYMNNETACKLENYKKVFTLQDIYVNTHNLQHILAVCKKLKDDADKISPEKKQKYIEDIIKGFRYVISNTAILRMYQTENSRKNWWITQFSWNSSITTGDIMAKYLGIMNKNFDLSTLKLYIDGKEYTIQPESKDKETATEGTTKEEEKTK